MILWKIKKDHPNENKQRLFIQFPMAREAVTITCIWQSQRQEEWENFIMEKKDGFR